MTVTWSLDLDPDVTFLTVTMDDDNDMTTNVGGSRGSTALPKFNHLYPILFLLQYAIPYA